MNKNDLQQMPGGVPDNARVRREDLFESEPGDVLPKAPRPQSSSAARSNTILRNQHLEAGAAWTQQQLNWDEVMANDNHRPARDLAPMRQRDLVRPPQPWTGCEPPFRLASNGSFYGMDHLHPAEAVHILCSGGTGTGKTTSVVVPLIRAMLRYALPSVSGAKRPSMFIVDPKKELLPIVERQLAETGEVNRLLRIGVDGSLPPVRFFDPEERLTNREMLDRLDAVLRTKELSQGEHSYWHRAGLDLVLRFMGLEQVFKEATDQSLVVILAGRLGKQCGVGSFWTAISAVLDCCLSDSVSLRKANSTLCKLLTEHALNEHADASVLRQFTSGDDQKMQLHYRVQCVDSMLSLLRDESISQVVDLSPYPDGERPHLDLRAALDAGEVLLFQPDSVTGSEMAARALKTKVFDAVKSRSDMERPVGIVVDEYQKFITGDPLSGDATFLDTARAYRTNCVLATQSIGALLLALGSDANARSSVDAIVANTPTKWFFACKDSATSKELRALIPSLPSGHHVLDVRTLSQLRPGQAYWSLADGRWGRGHADLAGCL